MSSPSSAGPNQSPSTPRQIGAATTVLPEDGFDPSWEVVARLGTTTLDPGDAVRIELYFSGHGRVDSAKLVFYLHEGLFSPVKNQHTSPPDEILAKVTKSIGRGTRSGRLSAQPDSADQEFEFATQEIHELAVDAWGGTHYLSPGVFLERFASDESTPVKNFTRSASVIGAAGEVSAYNLPPLLIEATVSPKARAGDHEIPFVLTYKGRSKVATATGSVKLHVRAFWERPAFQILTTIAVVLAGAAAISDLLHLNVVSITETFVKWASTR